MPELDQRSKELLDTCHPDLQRVVSAVARHLSMEIREAYVDRESHGETFCTAMPYGQSAHNTVPPTAVDAMLLPRDWDNRDKMNWFLGYLQGVADTMGIAIKTEFPNHVELVGYDAQIIDA